MVTLLELHTFDEFSKYVENIKGDNPPIYFYFTGNKDADGGCWCPDCVEAEPIVKACLEELKKTVIFVYVYCGDRPYWKDKACPFRTDPRSKLMVIPTMIKWKGVQRLEGSQCSNPELLQMMFEDEE